MYKMIVALVMSPLFLSGFLTSPVGSTTPKDNLNKPSGIKGRLKVTGLEVHRSALKKDEAPWLYAPRSGVSVHLLVAVPGKVILDLGEESSQLIHFVDDKGTDLLKAKDGKKLQSCDWLLREYGQMNFNSAGHCVMIIHSPQKPVTGATKLILKGQLACELGKDERKAEWERASLKEGKERSFGPIDVSPLDKGCHISTDKPNRLQGVVFIDREGKEIKAAKPSGYASLGSATFGNVTTRTYCFGKNYNLDVDYAIARVRYFAAHETVIIPINLEVTLGF